MKIIKEITQQEPFLIIDKPSGIPSAPLSLDDKNNAFSIAAQMFPQLLEVHGKKEIEHGLLHRIDTETSGLLIIAATQECYNQLIELQKQNLIKKYYSAKCNIDYENTIKLEGFPESYSLFNNKIKDYCLESYFRFYGEGRKTVRPVTKESNISALKKSGKPVLYTTNIKIIEQNKNIVTVEAQITNGFRHQVRCHLAWMGLPVVGDTLYNLNKSELPLQFTAAKLDINGKIFQIN